MCLISEYFLITLLPNLDDTSNLQQGKTLSYLLPILQYLLSAEDELKGSSEGGNASSVLPPNPKLTALVLCPTRELAMQVSNEYSKLVKSTAHDPYHNRINCGSIVGGLSEQKQKRILNVKRPPVLVATPGRLWDLVRNNKRGCTFYFILKVEEETLPLN